MAQRAILCPRCRQLIGSEEAVCSWCGTSRSATWWQFISWTRGALDGDWLIKSIITVNVLFYAISLLLSIGSQKGWQDSVGSGNVAAYLLVTMALYGAALTAAAPAQLQSATP